MSECVVDDNLFVKIIKMFLFFFSNNYFVWDCHIDNIVIREGRPFFVDFGGLEKQPYNKKHLIFEFLLTDCPEEFLADNYPESYNTEAFTIYWIADQLIKRCALNLSKKSSSILTKMHSKAIINRYSSFAEIIETLTNSCMPTERIEV